jgi:arabinofuranosyltransferase
MSGLDALSVRGGRSRARCRLRWSSCLSFCSRFSDGVTADSDDALINIRVVRQLLAGNGPVFNIGERVEVGTSPLWIYLVSLMRGPGLD